MLLEELRLFDNQVYGVVHGLLMGHREKWMVRPLLPSTMLLPTCSGTSVRNKAHSWWRLREDLGNFGRTCGLISAWTYILCLLMLQRQWFTLGFNEGHESPKVMSILTGWGKHIKVVGDGALRPAFEALLRGMDAPFHLSKCNMGRFTSSGPVIATWLRESATLKLLTLRDHIIIKANTATRSRGHNKTLRPLFCSSTLSREQFMTIKSVFCSQ